jgi:DNA gyrase subunit B
MSTTSSRVFAFANNIYNSEGGTHVTGFRTALTRTLNAYARKAAVLKEARRTLPATTCSKGLTAVVSVKMREIQFEGQTKSKLGSVEARGAVETVFGEAFTTFLRRTQTTRAIIGKAIARAQGAQGRQGCQRLGLRKGALEGMSLPGKLADCQSKDASESELFVVEGDSAGGSASRAATAARRRYSRCAARSSTSSAHASTKCSPLSRKKLGGGARHRYRRCL